MFLKLPVGVLDGREVGVAVGLEGAAVGFLVGFEGAAVGCTVGLLGMALGNAKKTRQLRK